MMNVLLPLATLRLKALRHPPLDALSRAAALSWLSHAAPRFAGHIMHSLASLASLLLLALLLAAVATLAVAFLNYIRINDSAPDSLPELLEDALEYDPEPYFPVALVGLALLLASFFLSLLLWLRLGCLAALRARAHCSRCQHDLTALPIRPDNTVHCPECAHLAHPIAPWNEYAPAAAPESPATFRPNVTLAPRFWTRRRLKLTAISVASVALLAALAFGAHWLYIDLDARRQAAQARAARLSPEEITQRVNEHRTPPTDREPKVADLLNEIASSSRAVTSDFNSSRGFDKLSFDEGGAIDVSEYGMSPDSKDAKQQTRHKHAEELLLAMRASGLIDRLHTLPTADPWFEVRYVPPDAPGWELPVWRIGELRNAGRIALADLRYCQSTNDDAGVNRAIRTLEALTMIADSGCFLLDRLVKNAIESLLLTEYMRLLMQNPPEPWLNRIEQSLDRMPPSSFAQVYHRERLFMLDAAAAHYSDPARIKRAQRDEAFTDNPLGSLLNSDASVFGTFAQVRDSINAQIDAVTQIADLPPFKRNRIDPLNADEHRYYLANVGGAINKSLQMEDRQRLRRQTLRVMLALERFRLTHHRYPTTEEFALLFSQNDHAIDPYSGKLLGYRPASPDSTEAQPPYLLWSAGYDKSDNDGHHDPLEPDRAFRNRSDGTDIPLNVLKTW